MRRFCVLGAGIFAAAVLVANSGGQAAARPLANDAGVAKLSCKLTGVRYFGAAAGKARVCFTLNSKRTTMREYDYSFCPSASKLVGAASGRARPVAVKKDGSFTAWRAFLTAGEGLDFVNVGFSGRVQGDGAAGLLVGERTDGTKIFKCSWKAHRVSG